MIEIIATIFYTFELSNFNNSLHLNVCGIIHDASYIYLDSKEILFGAVNNSTITHFNYTLANICNETLSSWDPAYSLTNEDNTLVTQLPQYTVTSLQTDNTVMQNLTRDVMISNGKCSLQNYSFMIVAAVTFLIGLILQPDSIYKALQTHFRERLNAGNNFSRIRTEL